ncbi:General alpha-glucoside permease [Sparassis crispa]|uniref:General alpha-glucoside permease n=1 Tax=Sparassis crispa TaxID=139825 RepID=A0A401H1N7_9APHY|nr:General alpha-glucoside permease [Sparassis crispa]GBE88356.1 General alpha-glucoside permease [Sparassis crispa]
MSSAAVLEKAEGDPSRFEDAASFEKGKQYGNLTALAQAAATERALTPLQAIRTYWRAFFWSIFMCMGALLWGYDSQVGGGLLSVPSFRRDFGYEADGGWVLAARWQSAFNSISSIGGMFGGLSLGYISDKFGRRGAVVLCCLVSITGIFIQFFTPPHKNGMLLAGKLINGYALGMYVSGASAYSAEVSPLALRGITTASVNLWIDLGQFMSNGVIEGTGNFSSAYAYRLPFALQWIFPAILLAGLPFAPESPWWLVRKGRVEDARKVIIRLAGDSTDIDLQLHQICETIELEETYAANSTYMDCFRGVNLRRTVIASMVFVLQQAAGVVFVLGFSTYFFELAGFADSKAFQLGVGVTALGVVGNLLTFYTVNRYGRRFIFNWTMLACTVVLFLIGFLSIPTSQGAKWAMSIFTLVYNFIYQTGIGPLGYVIFAEVSSAKLRSKTIGLGILTNSMCGMVANIVIPYLVNPDEANLGGKVGFIFGGLAAFGTIWAWFYIPETKGLTVDQIDTLFERGISPRHFQSINLEEEEVPEVKA